jgi:group I intron endonuclease
LLKYGQHNFAVLIIEYAETETINVRETSWISQLLPYYNVLKQGYSSLGYKHTEATKELLSNLAKNRIHSDETKDLIAKALTGENNPFYGKTHSEESKFKISKANSAFPLYVYNSLRQLVMICPSVISLADTINTNSSTITNSIENESLFRALPENFSKSLWLIRNFRGLDKNPGDLHRRAFGRPLVLLFRSKGSKKLLICFS